MPSIKVSIIIPVYNGEKYIEKCARSLFEQSMNDIEFLFIDDCGNDKSINVLQNIINQYSYRKDYVKIIRHNHNKGMAGARNTGIDHSTGEYLFFIDQDDYIDTDAIETFYKKAKEEDADLVYSNFLWQFAKFNTKYIYPPYVDKKDLILNTLNLDYSPVLWSKLYKKTLFTDNNIRLPENTLGADDLVTTPILYYYANKIAQLNFFPYHYTYDNLDALTKKGTTISWINQIQISIQILEEFFLDKGQEYVNALEESKVKMNLDLTITSSRTIQKQAFNTFSNVNYPKYYNTLTMLQKVTLLLAKHNLFFILNVVLNVRTFGGIIKRKTKSLFNFA